MKLETISKNLVATFQAEDDEALVEVAEFFGPTEWNVAVDIDFVSVNVHPRGEKVRDVRVFRYNPQNQAYSPQNQVGVTLGHATLWFSDDEFDLLIARMGKVLVAKMAEEESTA